MKLTPIGHGNMVSRKDALALCQQQGRKLPRPGYESKVFIDGQPHWLARTKHYGKIVWYVR